MHGVTIRITTILSITAGSISSGVFSTEANISVATSTFQEVLPKMANCTTVTCYVTPNTLNSVVSSRTSILRLAQIRRFGHVIPKIIRLFSNHYYIWKTWNYCRMKYKVELYIRLFGQRNNWVTWPVRHCAITTRLIWPWLLLSERTYRWVLCYSAHSSYMYSYAENKRQYKTVTNIAFKTLYCPTDAQIYNS